MANGATLYLGASFLFQTGAIKSAFFYDFMLFLYMFLFQTGAIKRKTDMLDADSIVIVSIPNWCD